MRIFLTGATGFLGGAIAGALLARQHELAMLARPGAVAARFGALCRIVRGDLFEPDGYRPELKRFRPEALIHCGWFGVAGAERDNLRQLDNVPASARLFQAAIDAGATRIVGVGSQAEYGPKSGRIREDESCAPTTLYGVAKLATAQALSAMGAAQSVSSAWGRVFSLYGPGSDASWLIPSLIRSFSEGRAPELTLCEQLWEFTHVDDAAQAVVALVETPSATGFFNIGAGEARPLREVVLYLRDEIAPEIEPKFGAVPYRPDQVMHLEADIAKIRDATGWSPKTPLERGLVTTLLAQGCKRMAVT